MYFNSTAAAVPPNCRSSKYKLGRCPTCPGLATLPCSTAAITKILVKYSNESLWIRSGGPPVLYVQLPVEIIEIYCRATTNQTTTHPQYRII